VKERNAVYSYQGAASKHLLAAASHLPSCLPSCLPSYTSEGKFHLELHHDFCKRLWWGFLFSACSYPCIHASILSIQKFIHHLVFTFWLLHPGTLFSSSRLSGHLDTYQQKYVPTNKLRAHVRLFASPALKTDKRHDPSCLVTPPPTALSAGTTLLLGCLQ